METEGTFVCFADNTVLHHFFPQVMIDTEDLFFFPKADIALARRALISGFQPKM